jgi:hypothetical protein
LFSGEIGDIKTSIADQEAQMAEKVNSLPGIRKFAADSAENYKKAEVCLTDPIPLDVCIFCLGSENNM